jgi:hypothetical protein
MLVAVNRSVASSNLARNGDRRFKVVNRVLVRSSQNTWKYVRPRAGAGYSAA